MKPRGFPTVCMPVYAARLRNLNDKIGDRSGSSESSLPSHCYSAERDAKN